MLADTVIACPWFVQSLLHQNDLTLDAGVQLATAFSKRTTHLLCPSGAGPKYEKAGEWNIPVVNREWLTAIATTGTIPFVSEYSVVPGAPGDHTVEKDSAIVDIKGKGKADDNGETRNEFENEADDFLWAADKTDVMMNDITNGLSSELPYLTLVLIKCRTSGSSAHYHRRGSNVHIQKAIRRANAGTCSAT